MFKDIEYYKRSFHSATNARPRDDDSRKINAKTIYEYLNRLEQKYIIKKLKE